MFFFLFFFLFSTVFICNLSLKRSLTFPCYLFFFSHFTFLFKFSKMFNSFLHTYIPEQQMFKKILYLMIYPAWICFLFLPYLSYVLFFTTFLYFSSIDVWLLFLNSYFPPFPQFSIRYPRENQFYCIHVFSCFLSYSTFLTISYFIFLLYLSHSYLFSYSLK